MPEIRNDKYEKEKASGSAELECKIIFFLRGHILYVLSITLFPCFSFMYDYIPIYDQL